MEKRTLNRLDEQILFKKGGYSNLSNRGVI